MHLQAGWGIIGAIEKIHAKSLHLLGQNRCIRTTRAGADRGFCVSVQETGFEKRLRQACGPRMWQMRGMRFGFVNNGHPSHPVRMALGMLLFKRRLKCSDQRLVKHIGENPYLYYFIGMNEYGPLPFGAPTLVAFRKRFSEKDLATILEASVPKADIEKKDDSEDGNDPPAVGRWSWTPPAAP